MTSYASSAASAVAYLSQRLLREDWVAEHDDVAYYFKAPMAFLEAGDADMAQMALDIASKYAENGGAGSKNGAYAGDYVHYPWMWLCWAAAKLDNEELARNCWGRLYNFVHPVTCAGLVGAPYAAPSALSLAQQTLTGDLFATAEVAKMALLLNRRGVAMQAGDTIVRVLDANKVHMKEGSIFLRWRVPSEASSASKEVELVEEKDVFHRIVQGEPGQLYFLLAFPLMVLLELHEAMSEKGYREAALKMLDFLSSCTGVFESPMAHKVARAAAMAGDHQTARRIADFLVSQQQQAGCYQEDPEAMDSMDQTAEIAVWLLQIQRDLEPPARAVEDAGPRVAG